LKVDWAFGRIEVSTLYIRSSLNLFEVIRSKNKCWWNKSKDLLSNYQWLIFVMY